MLYIVEQGTYEDRHVIGVFDNLGAACAAFGILPDQLRQWPQSPHEWEYCLRDEYDDCDSNAITIYAAGLNTPIRAPVRYDYNG